MTVELITLHQGAIGDFLLTLPVIQAAERLLEVDRVVAIATAPSARLAAGRGVVDSWVSPEGVGLHRLFCRDLPLTERLSRTLGAADYVLSFLGGPAESIHQRLSGCLGARREKSSAAVETRLVSVDPRPSPETRLERRHITAQWADTIRRGGWNIPNPEPARILMARRASGSRRVLLHPGSGGRAKCWPLDRFFALADRLQDLDVSWMLGPAEVEEARRIGERDEPLLVEEDLIRASEQMCRFGLYVGNDGGMTHLAAAVGLPTVAIFAATDPLIWRPLGDHVTVVAPAEPEQAMESITVEMVHQAVRTSVATTT